MFEQDEKVSYLVDHETGMTVEHGTILEAHADHRFYSIRTEDGSVTYQPYEKLSRVVPFNDGEDSKRADYYAELYTDLRASLVEIMREIPNGPKGNFDELSDPYLMSTLYETIFKLVRNQARSSQPTGVLTEFIDLDGDTWIRNEYGTYDLPDTYVGWTIDRIIKTFGTGTGN